ncbi:MAG: BspA family leucine-rich repeat surface protein [Prevotella sp.]|nr:BspA family leucine-rich repeat surface protein [Prevotella sp.]
MKRKLFILFVLLASTMGVKAQEAYAVWYDDFYAVFYYDCNRSWWTEFGGNLTVSLESSSYNVKGNEEKQFKKVKRKMDDFEDEVPTTWEELKTRDIRTIIIDESIKEYSENLTYIDWFQGMEFLTTIENVENLNTKNVTDMSYMFSDCSSLTSLDLSSFDTRNVTDMSYMFFGCSHLTSLDLGNFNTQNVTTMESMFVGCRSLISLDLSSFDTKNVTDMSGMFANCTSLTSLDLGNFNTQNVTTMESMFVGCRSLTSLDLSSFDTGNVTDMSWMFFGFESLPFLDLSNFNTQNVTTMLGMFQQSFSLISIDLSSFDTKNVTDMSQMFEHCTSLTSLDLSSFDTGNVTMMHFMFYDCPCLTSLDLSNFNTESLKIMNNMFDDCSSLTFLDMSNFNAENVISGYSFSGCSSLNRLRISASLGNAKYGSFEGVGSETSPCHINHPDGLDFGVDTSGDYFEWKGGYFTLREDLAEEIKVTSNLGYITYCSDKALDFTNVEGMKAYTVVGFDGNVAKLSRMGIVPAETGLILKVEAGNYEIPYTEEDNYVVNMLVGALEATTIAPMEDDMTNLVLANGNNGLGFYLLKGTGALAAHRAYLQVPTRMIENGAKFIRIEFDDDVTAISGIKTQEEAAPYYDLQGVRHEGKPCKQGIYIMNGKKVVVKD